MRKVHMQVLTWGTIAGAIASALLLAALEGTVPRYSIGLPVAMVLPTEPGQAGQARPRTLPSVASAAAAVPKLAER